MIPKKFRVFDTGLKKYSPYHALMNYDDKNIWIVEQWSGAKDINGKEIYEGDIITGEIDGIEIRGLVFFSEDNFCFEVEVEKSINLNDIFLLCGVQFPEVVGNNNE